MSACHIRLADCTWALQICSLSVCLAFIIIAVFQSSSLIVLINSILISSFSSRDIKAHIVLMIRIMCVLQNIFYTLALMSKHINPQVWEKALECFQHVLDTGKYGGGKALLAS